MNYVVLGAKVDAVLRRVGLVVTVKRGSTTLGTGYGVFVKSEAQNMSEGASDYRASTAVTGRALLLSGLAVEPLVNDIVTADGHTFGVNAVEKVRPTTTTLLYKLELC